jgi:hypothetical protein
MSLDGSTAVVSARSDYGHPPCPPAARTTGGPSAQRAAAGSSSPDALEAASCLSPHSPFFVGSVIDVEFGDALRRPQDRSLHIVLSKHRATWGQSAPGRNRTCDTRFKKSREHDDGVRLRNVSTASGAARISVGAGIRTLLATSWPQQNVGRPYPPRRG